ncbi:MAG: substrate-binding domain-containing protein [Thiomargarita sp.]|nr:substrate-binding domain-containing protein [Thiomargarita sp.]
MKTYKFAIVLFFSTFLGTLLGVGVATQLIDINTITIIAENPNSKPINNPKPIIAESFNSKPVIKIVGNNTILGIKPLMDEWQTEFKLLTRHNIPITETIDLTIKIDNTNYTDIKQLVAKQANLLITSVPISEAEMPQLNNQGINIACAAEIGYDIIVFITDLRNHIDSITETSLQKILKGEYAHWSDINPNLESKPIHLFFNAKTNNLILPAFIDSNAIHYSFIQCKSNSNCLNQMLSTEGAIYWVSAAWLYTQPKKYINPFFIQHRRFALTQNPFETDFKLNNYHIKLIRPLYIYVFKNSEIETDSFKLAKKFFKYVRGVQGQEILEKNHFYTYFNPPTEVKSDLPKDFGTRINQLPVVCK